MYNSIKIFIFTLNKKQTMNIEQSTAKLDVLSATTLLTRLSNRYSSKIYTPLHITNHLVPMLNYIPTGGNDLYIDLYRMNKIVNEQLEETIVHINDVTTIINLLSESDVQPNQDRMDEYENRLSSLLVTKSECLDDIVEINSFIVQINPNIPYKYFDQN